MKIDKKTFRWILLLSILESLILAWIIRDPITRMLFVGKTFEGRSLLVQFSLLISMFCFCSIIVFTLYYLFEILRTKIRIPDPTIWCKKNEKVILIVISLMGIFLRVRQYLYARSLWFDELSLAHNFIKYDISYLVSNPLDSRQSAPLGFVIISDLIGSLFNYTDQSLRFFPFILGIGVVVLSVIVSKYMMPPIARFVFIWLISTSPAIIYYSNELKPYIADVFFYLLILAIVYLYHEKKVRITTVTLIGCIAILFSFPSVIFLFIFGVIELLDSIKRKRKVEAVELILSSFFWLVLFIVIFMGYTRRFSPMDYYSEFWGNKFAPLSISNLKWYWDAFLEFTFLGFHPYRPIRVTLNPNQFELNNLIIAGIIILGMILQGIKYKRLALFNGGILLLAILLSAFKLYPFGSRMSLYLIPISFSLLSIVVDNFLLRSTYPIKLIGYQVIGFLLVLITIPSINNFFNPIDNADIKHPLQYLHDKSVSTDALTMIDDTYPAFSFYSKKYNLPNYSQIFAFPKPFNVPEYQNFLCSNLKKEYVWILITQMFDEGKEFITELSDTGTLLDKWESSGSGLYYFQFDLNRICENK